VITPRHGRDGFYKYYTAESAKLTLERVSRKWSSPLLFNDPFDNQYDLDFPETTDELVAENTQQFLAVLTSPEPIKPNQFGSETPMMEFLWLVHQNNPDLKYTDDEIAYLEGGALEGMQNVRKIAPEANVEIRRVMDDSSIFCVSETNDNILMWSHYAAHHTGVVIKFLALMEVDSPLIVAQPVRYSREIPHLSYGIMMDSERGPTEIRETLTLSKSEDWAYEREWRVCATLRDKTQTYEILPYAPEEVGEVYLGCKIAADMKAEIIGITRRNYPKARIFQAEKHDSRFELVFREIT
jgi:hypothetical protein